MFLVSVLSWGRTCCCTSTIHYQLSYGREKLLLVWGEGKVFIASGLIMWGHSSFASTVSERGSPFYGAGESSSQFSPW